jgi:hypothetical protein
MIAWLLDASHRRSAEGRDTRGLNDWGWVIASPVILSRHVLRSMLGGRARLWM